MRVGAAGEDGLLGGNPRGDVVDGAARARTSGPPTQRGAAIFAEGEAGGGSREFIW